MAASTGNEPAWLKLRNALSPGLIQHFSGAMLGTSIWTVSWRLSCSLTTGRGSCLAGECLSTLGLVSTVTLWFYDLRVADCAGADQRLSDALVGSER